MAQQRAATLRRRIPAYALLRACVIQDQDAALLLVDQARQAGSLDLLVFNVAYVAARAMLSAEAYDMAKVLAALDHWLQVASSGVPGPKGQAACPRLTPARTRGVPWPRSR